MRLINPSAPSRATAAAIAAAASELVGTPSIRARLFAGVNHVALSFGAAARQAAANVTAANPLQAPVVVAR